MNIKKYKYQYGTYDAEVHFDVDLDIFTEELAKATLDFFSWDWSEQPDINANPIDEVMKKYAKRAIQFGAFNDTSAYGVKCEFEEMEGYCPVDGSHGIVLTYFEGHTYDSEYLTLINDED